MKILTVLAFILALNFYLFASQLAVTNSSIEENIPTIIKFYNYENSLLSDYDNGSMTLNQNINSELPTAGGQIDTSDPNSNIFVDTFTAVYDWFSQSTGITYLKGIVTSFPNLLKGMGLPEEIAFGLGAIWHAITVFLIIAVLRGYY